ncbi:hypothetical protein PC117_g14305 [Phytophthora cactorum]|nr:hypothetical protein PC117_g14305 [Phytophthora cactorum]
MPSTDVSTTTTAVKQTTESIDQLALDKELQAEFELSDDAFSDDLPQTLPIAPESPNKARTTADISTVTTETTAVTAGTPAVATGTLSVFTGIPSVSTGTNTAATGTATITTGTDEMHASILTKRQPTSSASEGLDAPRRASFTISKSAKSRGRPKVRKQQKVSQKKSQMYRGKQKAMKLVQETLAPVPSLSNLVKVLDEDCSYNDLKKSMQILLERSLPQTKKAIAGMFTPDECETDIRYIFPQWFVTKAQSAIQQFRQALGVDCGADAVDVRVPRFGIYQA